MRHRSTAAIATVAFGAVLAAASWVVPATAKARPDPAGTSKAAAATTAPAFPTFVRLPADQAAQPTAADEWWYVVGHLNAHGHRFGYEVQIGGPAPYVLIAITDKTTGAYYSQSQFYPPDQTSFSTTALEVRTPSATLSGPMDAMHLHASLPAGEINLTLTARGPALYNNGTGLMPFLGGTSYYYSLPSLASHGTLTENDHTTRWPASRGWTTSGGHGTGAPCRNGPGCRCNCLMATGSTSGTTSPRAGSSITRLCSTW